MTVSSHTKLSQFEYIMRLTDGSEAKRKLREEGVKFTADVPPPQRKDILDRLVAMVEHLEAFHRRSASHPLESRSKTAFAQMKARLAGRIARIITRGTMKDTLEPADYVEWDRQLNGIEHTWEPWKPKPPALPDSWNDGSFEKSHQLLGAAQLSPSTAVASENSVQSAQNRLFAQHIFDPQTGETVSGTSSSFWSEGRVRAAVTPHAEDVFHSTIRRNNPE